MLTFHLLETLKLPKDHGFSNADSAAIFHSIGRRWLGLLVYNGLGQPGRTGSPVLSSKMTTSEQPIAFGYGNEKGPRLSTRTSKSER